MLELDDRMVGWLGAAVAALFWGSYLVPVQRLPQLNPLAAQLGMAIGIGGSGLVGAIAADHWSFTPWGLLAGAIWALGNFASIFVVRSLGLARGLAAWAAIGIVVSFLWGVAFFRESVILGWAIGGLGLLIGGIALMNWPERSTVSDRMVTPQRRGWLLCVITGLLFGSQSVPFALAGQDPIAFLPSMSAGIALTALLLAVRWYRQGQLVLPRSACGPLMLSGLLWNVANLGNFFALDHLGLAVGIPLTQFAVAINTAWGLFLFREATSRQRQWCVGLGTLLAFAGIALVGAAQGT
jgi:glucose uptake protein GlcU